MTPSSFDKKSEPKYLALANYFRDQVRSGALKPGDKLPTYAEMLAKHGVGQGTLERAYALLEDERIIIREPKRGTYVAPTQPESLGVIGVYVGGAPHEFPYYAHLMSGIHEAAYRLKVELLHLHDSSSVRWEKMDGVLTTHTHIRIPPTMPAVALVTSQLEVPCVIGDDYEGGRVATQHLLDLGHRRIAYLSLGGDNDIAILRRKAYLDTMKGAGIEVDKRWQRRLQDWPELFGPERGLYTLAYEKMSRWLREDWRELGCTAVLAQNDEAAVSVIKALNEAGLQVPRDVSVVGFDGTEVADHYNPSITTVKVPLRDIAKRGMELLLGMIHGNTSPHERDEVLREVWPVSFKAQGSTAPPPQS